MTGETGLCWRSSSAQAFFETHAKRHQGERERNRMTHSRTLAPAPRAGGAPAPGGADAARRTRPGRRAPRAPVPGHRTPGPQRRTEIPLSSARAASESSRASSLLYAFMELHIRTTALYRY